MALSREEKLARRREHYRNNADRLKTAAQLRSRANYLRDPAAYNARNRAYYAQNREKRREYYLRVKAAVSARYNHSARLKRYGLTEAEFGAMQERDPSCAICGIKTRLGIDHDHRTGRVRGLLCNHCNATLHRLETVPGWIDSATVYLHR